MQVIEFETTILQQQIHIPEYLAEGTPVRVLLLLKDQPTPHQNESQDWKNLLSAIPNVGEDEDFYGL